MSECVVRMTLPKACVWRDDKGNIKMCPLYWEDEARCQGKDGKEAPWYDGKRPDWCPIICSLPEGHGDLIDRDALIDMVKTEDIALYTCFDSDDAYYSVTDLITILMMQEEIIKAKRKVDASDAVAPNDTPTDTPTVPEERRSE